MAKRKRSSSKKPASGKKAAAKRPASGGSAKRRGAPSVKSFLERLQGPARDEGAPPSPARGLLGDISREDLRAAGRLPSDEGPSVKAEVERPTEVGDFDERYEDLVDEDASGGQSSGQLTTAARRQNRRSDRRPWSAPVEIRGVLARGAEKNTARNLSLGGVFVETAALLEVGDPVVLTLPDAEGGKLSIPGRVRWVTPFGDLSEARPGMGIEFVGVDERRRRRLEALLAGLPRAREAGR